MSRPNRTAADRAATGVVFVGIGAIVAILGFVVVGMFMAAPVLTSIGVAVLAALFVAGWIHG